MPLRDRGAARRIDSMFSMRVVVVVVPVHTGGFVAR
jgi:hypothetical protein